MTRFDMPNHPELERMMIERYHQAHAIRMQRHIAEHDGESILSFWTTLSREIEKEDELQTAEIMLRELRDDISMLKAVKESLNLRKDDPTTAPQLLRLLQILQMLLEAEDKIRRWLRHLKDKAFHYHMLLNPAIPSKVKAKMEADKDKKAAGQQKSQKHLDETKKPKKEPTKKMQP